MASSSFNRRLFGTLALTALLALSACKRSENCGCSEAEAASPRRALGLLLPPQDSPIYPERSQPASQATGEETIELDASAAAGQGILNKPPPADSTQRQEAPRTATPCLHPPPEGMACVPGGYFLRGVDEDAHTCDQASQPARGTNMGTTPEQRVWLDTFYIDKTEVTNAAYATCLDSRSCPKDGPRYADFSAPQQPITGVSWYSADTFCRAQGKHLQREAEFEKAVRGADGDINPWGNEPATCENSIIMDESGRSCGRTKKGSYPNNGRVMEVASRPAGRYEIYDLIGNAEEWVWDYWSKDWETCGDACSGDNPQGPCDGEEPCAEHRYRVVRGGSWYWPASHANGYHRRAYRPNNEPAHHFGFRCAASQAEATALTTAAK